MPSDVAVVITFYRNDAHFPAALASVLAQTHPAHEIVVVDDASPAGSATTLVGLDPRVRVLRLAENGGPGAARQAGSEATTACWIAYLDGDDLWQPEKLARQLAFAADHPDHSVIHCALTEFRPDGRERVFDRKPEQLSLAEELRTHHLMPSSLLLRRDALKAIGGWHRGRALVQDHDLGIRLLLSGAKVGFVKTPLVRFRRFDHGNLSSRRWWQMRRNLAVIQRHRRTYLATLGVRGTLACCGRAIAELGRNPGTVGRMARVLGWTLGYRGA
ncbi:MAG TPA: glycosyltransferase family 2 protein [Rhodanobacteraceae bacterium]|nr:glycosyltransferase family 2 protein [Rhodanobacteraceae bacterium]